MVIQPSIPPVSGDLMPSSRIWEQQAHMWYTDTPADKTSTHTKYMCFLTLTSKTHTIFEIYLVETNFVGNIQMHSSLRQKFWNVAQLLLILLNLWSKGVSYMQNLFLSQAQWISLIVSSAYLYSLGSITVVMNDTVIIQTRKFMSKWQLQKKQAVMNSIHGRKSAVPKTKLRKI